MDPQSGPSSYFYSSLVFREGRSVTSESFRIDEFMQLNAGFVFEKLIWYC
jgi:hypothetical protein